MWGRSGCYCPSPVGCRDESEGGEACQVGGGGEKVEVGVDFGSSPDPGFTAPVGAAHHMAEFAFDFGSGGPIVGDPAGILGLVAGLGETLFVAADPDAAAVFGVGAFGSESTAGAVVGEEGAPVAVGTATDADRDAGRAGDGVSLEVDTEPVLGEPAGGCGGRLGLAAGVDVGLGEIVQELSAAVGGIPIHDGPILLTGLTFDTRLSGLLAGGLLADGLFAGCVLPVDEVADEIGGYRGVTGVAGGDRRVGDDLRIRVDGHMTLVTVETPVVGFVAVTGLGVDRGDHPVLGHLAGDPEH